MMINAAMFIFLDTSRRHSRIYSRSSGSIPDAIFALAPEVSRLPAEPHQPPPRALASADAFTGKSFPGPGSGRGARVNVIDAAAATDAALATAPVADFPRRFERGVATGSRSHPISQPHTSQAPHVAHFGLSPKCKQIWRCRQPVDSTKLRIM